MTNAERGYQVVPHTVASSSVPESHRDFTQRALYGSFTTLNPDGSPQSTAVGYVCDDDGTFQIEIKETRQKYRNLHRDPRCSLLIIDPDVWPRALEIRATAVLEPDVDEQFYHRLHEVYDMGHLVPEAGKAYFIAKLLPIRVIAQGPAEMPLPPEVISAGQE